MLSIFPVFIVIVFSHNSLRSCNFTRRSFLCFLLKTAEQNHHLVAVEAAKYSKDVVTN